MDFLLNKIDESWDTPTKLDEKMNDLKRKMEELKALKEDTESRKSKELHPRKKLKKGVELWFRNVDRINSEIQDLEQKMGESSTTFFRGLFKANVSKKTEEVEELLQQGKSHDSLVVDNPGSIGQALSTSTLSGEAAKSCMEEIWGYLMGADVQKIGVWGMGGIGKTTIMKLINNKLLKETGKFNIVIWVTISKEMNIFKMQNKIARAMEETLDEDEDEKIRAGQIYEMLARKGKYVLILDDLWHEVSLEEAGIPEPSNGSKLLVTTRLLNVCRYLDCQEVKVPPLSKQDAWSLFSEKVGQDVLNRLDLLPIVESVADECAGLPLAIVTIASSMRRVHDVCEWRNALDELKRHGKCANGMEEKVFQQLQFSYERLGEENVKHCFLCCALYPEDHEIDTEKLIELWIAEGLVEEMDNKQKEIDKGHTILNKLTSSSLIEDVNRDEDQVFPDEVKLHDVVRDMAIRITSVRPRFLVRSGMQLKEIMGAPDWDEDLEKASFMENPELQIPPQMPPPKCPKLTTLLLPNCNIQSIPECFFEQMHGLKILDLSGNRGIKSLPNSISNLKTLTTLLVHWCIGLRNVPSVSKLEALKKLDLTGTKIKEIPDGMERLVNLKYLALSATSIKKILDGILGKLTSLQDLSLDRDTLVRGEEIGGLRKLERSRGGKFYDLKDLNSYVQRCAARTKTPGNYSINVGDHIHECPTFVGDRMIEINGCDIISTDGDIKVLSDVGALAIRKCSVDSCEEGALLSRFTAVPLDIFSCLGFISIYQCKNIKKLFSPNWVLNNLQNLHTLIVSCCEDMEEIIASESEWEEEGRSALKYAFPKLWSLQLTRLPELKSICGANGVIMVGDSITEIVISNCPKLKRIPLNFPLQDDGQPSPPRSLHQIVAYPKEWWESVEWDHPNAKSTLEPYIDKSTLVPYDKSIWQE